MTNTKTEALIGRCTDCGKEYNQNKHFLCPCVKTEALQRAIDYLGAREVAPGRYAFPSNATPNRWWLCGEANIALTAASMGDRAVRHDFTNLKACVLAPAWWSPDRQYAIRRGELPDSILVRMAHPDDCNSPYPAYKVTCDLMTGQEIPC